jgi:hypothetical protein
MTTEKGGQPRMFETPEEFDAAFEAYCQDCDDRQEKPTMSGLAWFMGFASRQSIWEYRKKPGFEHVANRAALFVEKGYEQQLAQGRGDGGIVFALKNFGWTDKQDVNHTSSDGSMSPKGKSLDDFYADTDD